MNNEHPFKRGFDFAHRPQKKDTNKQPFYHSFTVRFTATEEMNHSEIEERIRRTFNRPVLRDTIVVEEVDVEAGNPQDLMP